jgi:HAD superfamily hydrolase (TIGR01509 family)
MLRAVLFDFDGVIVLSEPLHFAAFAEVLARRGVALREDAYYDRYLGLTDRETIERIIEDSGRDDLAPHAARLFEEKSAAMAERIARGVPLCPGVEGFVAAVAGRHALAIVSAGLRGEIVAMLERAGLRRFFATIVDADDVRAGKPDPEGYRLAVARLRGGARGLAPGECLAVEDSPKGIDAAHAAGMAVLALPHTRPRQELGEADFVAGSYAEVDWAAIEARFR